MNVRINKLQYYKQKCNDITQLKNLSAKMLDEFTLFIGREDKKIDLCLLALVHGNEVGNIDILNDLLDNIYHGKASISINLAITLGNVDAYLKNQRFIEKDLNRSYGTESTHLQEDNVAKRLEKILKNCHYVIDLHQTSEPSLSPFFLFRFKPEMYHFARSIAPKTPIITFWDGVFYSEGLTTNEFVRSCGNVCVTIEMGGRGFHNDQKKLGETLITNALSYVKSPPSLDQIHRENESPFNKIYTWFKKISVTNKFIPTKNLKNFAMINKGDLMGTDKDVEIYSGVDGTLLFPTYIFLKEQDNEFCRLIKKIHFADIPKE